MKMNSKIIFSVILLLLFFLPAVNSTTYAENIISAEPDSANSFVKDVTFSKDNGEIIIKYFLEGSEGKEYNVDVVLRRADDPNYHYIPKKISGDIGKVKYTPTAKRIMWQLADEFPTGLLGKDYYFEINAKDISNDTSFLSIIGIGVAAVGAVVAYIIIGKQKPSGPTKTTFPEPPARP